MRRAFTYIEMTVVILVVGLLASIAVRNLVSDQSARDVWQFKSRLVALAQRARTRSIESGSVVSMYFSQDGGAFGSGSVSIVQEGKDGSQVPLMSLDLPREVKATKFDADKDEAQGTQWRLPYYPDGATAGGGIEFQYGKDTFCFSVGRTSTGPRILNGELPDLSLEKWDAGGYAPRS
jgi:prepilin-type N-terminal cleavage/methylation domain-containing protein